MSAPAAAQNSRAPQGAAPGAEAPTLNLQPSTFNSRPQDGQGAEAPLSGSNRAQSPTPRSGSSFHISYFISHISWRGVLSSLRAFLRRHGWNLAWTDNDLSALLARSARSVSAQSAPDPSAKSDQSDPRFSDDLDVSQAFPAPIPSNLTAKDLEKRLEPLAKKNLLNRDSGTVAQINGDQRGKMISRKALDKSINNGFTREEHFQAVANIEALYENAVLIHTGGDSKNNDPLIVMRRFAAPIVLNGTVADALLTAKESLDKENSVRVYSLELDEIVAAIKGERLERGASRLQRPEDDRTHADDLPEGIRKLQQKHEKVKRALDFFNKNSSVAPSPGAEAPLSSGSAATLAEPNGRHLRGGSAADTFERPTDATLPQSGPVRFADDPAYEAKAAAIAKILYRYTGTSYLVEPEEAASILAKGGWRLDPVNDEELLRYSAALAVKMKRERALKARHERERNAINNADEWTKLLMEKYGENFKINPGPKYDGSHEPFTGTWIDHRKTEKARAASSIPAEEAAKFLTEKTGKEVSPDMVVSHYADLKREGLLSAYREKRRKKSELYEIEQVIEEDERLDSGAEPLSTDPIEESEYKKKLRQKFQKEAAEKEQVEIDRWLYDNVQEWHWIADALGGLNLRFGFTLRPAARFAGEDFTGSFISPDWRRWSEFRPGKRTGKALADYKALREKHLKDAPVKSIP